MLLIIVRSCVLSTLLVVTMRSQTNSVLGSINCGIGGQATCYQASFSKLSGGVRCSCLANCLGPSCITPSIGSTRGVVWGLYVPGAKPCLAPLTGIATGGTTTYSNPSTTTALFTQVTLTGIYLPLNLSYTSRQVVDCFAGTVRDDDLIEGLCN